MTRKQAAKKTKNVGQGPRIPVPPEPSILDTLGKSAEQIASDIEKIQKAMEVFDKSRLRRDAIVLLIHAKSGVAKGTIDVVLNNLEKMADTWLKKS